MDPLTVKHIGEDGGSATASKNSSSASETSSTEEEERLRRLFHTCDRDNDGLIDRHDLLQMCHLLGMEDSYGEITTQLGIDGIGHISFDDFVRCRMGLVTEIEQEKRREELLVNLTVRSSSQNLMIPDSSDNSLGIPPSSGDYDSGTRDLSPERSSLIKLAEIQAPELLQRIIEYSESCENLGFPNFLEIVNSLYFPGDCALGYTMYKKLSRRWSMAFSNPPDDEECNSRSCARSRLSVCSNDVVICPPTDDYDRHSSVKDFRAQSNELLSKYTPLKYLHVKSMPRNLHLAALNSLKGEVIELSSKLHQVIGEKDSIEKQLSRQQSEKLRSQRDLHGKVEQISVRYEDRITELHSVIAELRKKIDRTQINVIREEEEHDANSDEQCISNRSIEDTSDHENNGSRLKTRTVDVGNAGLSRDINETWNAIKHKCDQDKWVDQEAAYKQSESKISISGYPGFTQLKQPIDFSGALRSTTSMEPNVTKSDNSPVYKQVKGLQAENDGYHHQIGRQEVELNRLRATVGSLREERDKYKRKIGELQSRYHNQDSFASPVVSRTSTPTRSQKANSAFDLNVGETKLAELKKLKTGNYFDRHVTGAEISSQGLPNSKVAEHLAQTLQECSNVQEIIQTVYTCGNQISENKVKEFEIELERLQSKIDSLKSQNDLLSLTLDESKFHCDRLTVLIGKYESNFTAIQLAMNYTDQLIAAMEVLLSLRETDLDIILVKCRAAGLGSIAGRNPDQDESSCDINDVLKNAFLARKSAEHLAKHLIIRCDRNDTPTGTASKCLTRPWDDLSSNSRTASTTSSTESSSDTEFSKLDEQKLRDCIQLLKNDRALIKMTIVDLESVHINPVSYDSAPNPDAQRLDLENAVLMQELMAMKEEKAELKAQNYLLEKEKATIDLQLSGKESQEQAYLVQIEHLKSEVKESQQLMNNSAYSSSSILTKDITEASDVSATPAITLAELRASHQNTQTSQDFLDALRREQKLKSRVQELVQTLEKLSRNSEIRHQQSAEFVNDLKRANSALVSAFEKAKRKYQGKLKKLESQMQTTQERLETQVAMYRKRSEILEEEITKFNTNETSL